MRFHHIPDLPLAAFSPEPGGRLKLYKGGSGGGAEKYDNLENLYQVQTDNAKLLLGQAQQYLPGATAQYMKRVQETQGPEYVEKQVGNAKADMAKANAMERSATSRELQSMGVNPNDSRFARGMQGAELSNAARMAAGVNSVRDQAKQYQFAASQDALGTMTGTNNSAVSQLGNASSGLSNLYTSQQNAKIQKDQMRSQQVSNAVGGAFSLLMSKDGGRVRGLERHCNGGMTGKDCGTIAGGGITNSPGIPTPITGSAPTQGNSLPLTGMVKAGQNFIGAKGNSLLQKMQLKGQNVMSNFGKAAEFFGAPQAGEIQAYGSGMGMSAEQATSARQAYFSAAEEARNLGQLNAAVEYEQMGNSLASGAGLNYASVTPVQGSGVAGAMAPGVVTGAETAGAVAGVSEAGAAATGAAAAGEAAAGVAAAGELGAGLSSGAGVSALTSGLGVVATALPWVGAAAGIGSLLGLFNEGGEVKTRDLRRGGRVRGPGHHTADLVPALLSNQENVVNAEGAALLGHDVLNRLNKRGLALRQQGKAPSQIKSIGLEALR